MGASVSVGVDSDPASPATPFSVTQTQMTSAPSSSYSTARISGSPQSRSGGLDGILQEPGNSSFNWIKPTSDNVSWAPALTSIIIGISTESLGGIKSMIDSIQIGSPLAASTIDSPTASYVIITGGGTDAHVPATMTPSGASEGVSITIPPVTRTSTKPTSTFLAPSAPCETLCQDKGGTRSGKMVPIVATLVPLVILSTISFVLYLWWRRRKIRRIEQEENLEDQAVWCTACSFGNPGEGNEQHRGRPVRRDSSVSAHSPTPLLSNRTKRGLGTFQQIRSVRDTEHSDHAADPFATPTSQLGPYENSDSANRELRPSQIGLALSTSIGASLSDTDTSGSGSIHTVVHHTVDKPLPSCADSMLREGRNFDQTNSLDDRNTHLHGNSDGHRFAPLGRRPDQFKENDKPETCSEGNAGHHECGSYLPPHLQEAASPNAKRSPPSLNRGSSDGNSSMPNLQDDKPKRLPRTETEELADLDLARRCIRSLKKEAFEAQKAAAAAEQQARGLREQD